MKTAENRFYCSFVQSLVYFAFYPFSFKMIISLSSERLNVCVKCYINVNMRACALVFYIWQCMHPAVVEILQLLCTLSGLHLHQLQCYMCVFIVLMGWISIVASMQNEKLKEKNVIT